MDLESWVKVFDRLLPRSRAWNLVTDRVLRKLFHGLAILPKTVRDYTASVLSEAFPSSTNYLKDWSTQFGSPVELTSTELAAEWADTGGQSISYLQGILHAAGYTNLFVHEWWVPGSSPVTARNPITLVPTSTILVNDLSWVDKDYAFQFGETDSQFAGDDSVTFGEYTGWTLVSKEYPNPDISANYPFYFYVCAATWPSRAVIAKSEYRKLIRLIYKIKPAHLRCILRLTLVDSVGDSDIQDVTYDPGEEYQDLVSGSDDEIQDVYGASGGIILRASLTTTKNGTFSMTLKGAGNINVDWGDGSVFEEFVLTAGGVACTHVYGDATSKTIWIYGALSGVTYLEAISQDLTDADVLSFTNVEVLYLYSNASLAMSIEPLAALTALTSLYLYNSLVTGSIEPLAALTALTSLRLQYTSVTGSIEPLAALTALGSLSLYNISITGSVEPLAALTALTYLNLANTDVSMTDAALPAWAGCTILLNDCAWTEDEVGYFLTNMADGVGTGGAINIAGNNANRKEPDTDAAVAAIVAVRPLTVNEAP